MTTAALRALSEALDEVRDRFAKDLSVADLQRLVEAGEVIDSLESAVEDGRASGGAEP